MASVNEVFDAAGNLLSRTYLDDNGQPITAQQATTFGTNHQAIAAALTQALADLQTILDSPDPAAGTLTATQLSVAVRQLASAVKTVALVQKRAIRYLTGDFTGSN